MRSPPRSEPRSDGYRLIDRFKFYPVPAEWLQVGCYPILMSLILAPAMGFASGWCRASEPRTCHWTRAAERSWTRDKDLSCMCMCKCCSSRYSLAVYKTHAWQHAPARLCPTSRSSATCVRSVNTVCLANMWITHYLVQAHVWTQIPPAVTVTMIQWPWKCLVISFKEPLGLIMLMAPPSCTACHCMSLHVTTCHRMFACCWSSVLQLRTKVLAKWLAPLHWCARSAVIAPGSAFHSAWAPHACIILHEPHVHACLHVRVFFFACNEGKDDLLEAMASASKSKANANRNLMQVIKKRGAAFAVGLDTVLLHVRVYRPKVKTVQLRWPVFPMASWLEALNKECPQFLYAGHCTLAPAKAVFQDFWNTLQRVDPSHPVYSSGKDLSCCIPCHWHGDEGRGSRKQPFLVQGWQPVIPWQGLSKTNVSGCLDCRSLPCYSYRHHAHVQQGIMWNPRHSFMTRLLHSCISSRSMTDETLDELNAAWCLEAKSLYEEGWEAWACMAWTCGLDVMCHSLS